MPVVFRRHDASNARKKSTSYFYDQFTCDRERAAVHFARALPATSQSIIAGGYLHLRTKGRSRGPFFGESAVIPRPTQKYSGAAPE
jgi:hypothetical protein